jgi:branched-chain amino acid transport system permease protein
MRSIEIVVMVVLGGSGSISGAVLAAMVLTFLPEGLRFLKNIHLGSFSGESLPINQLRLIIYSLLLILMMLLRPGGLLGRRELWFTRRKLATAEPRGFAVEVPPANPTV